MPFAVVGLPAFLAIFPGAGAVIARLLWSPGAARIFAFAFGLGVSEWLRGHVLTGFPWNSFGYALAAVPAFAQAAAYVGLWGLTFFALIVFATPAVLIDKSATARARLLPPVLAALFLIALAGFGTYRLATTPVGTVDGVMLRIMQPDLPQDEKFRTSSKDAVMDRYLSISDRASSPEIQGVHDVTHLFWPESAFPFFLERNADALARIAKLIAPTTVLVTGAARYEAPRPGDSSPHYYNSIRVLGTDGAIVATYDKVHLVPFGEYLPFQNLLERLGLTQLTKIRGGFIPGDRRRAMEVPRAPTMLPLICYEAIFPGAAVPDGERPGWLVNLTNDAWFGISSGPYQHFQQARMLAIAEGLPLVRAANDGISAVIDPVGRIVRSLPLGAEGVLDAPLPRAIEPTIYARFGNLVAILLMVTAGILLLRRRIAN
jgi:apolipoprotein N-acyltransferase